MELSQSEVEQMHQSGKDQGIEDIDFAEFMEVVHQKKVEKRTLLSKALYE